MDLAREAARVDDQKTVIIWASKAIEIEPSNADARALRAHALFLKGDWAAARADLEAMPRAELEVRPIVVADHFVCLVELADWAPAREASKAVPQSESARPDVVKAQQKLALAKPPAN